MGRRSPLGYKTSEVGQRSHLSGWSAASHSQQARVLPSRITNASINLEKAVRVISPEAPRLPENLQPSAYGVVFRAKEHRSSKIVALKQVRIPPEDRQNGVPITALREISILRYLKHDNIVNVLDVAVGSPMDEVYMVMEYCEQVSAPCAPRDHL